MTVAAAHAVSKAYGHTAALTDVTFTLREHAISGLLGRNGAGKTTLMRLLTGQELASSGSVELFGAHPYENDAALARVCFVKESQRYPDAFRVGHALRAAALLFPNWNDALALSLVDEFRLPRSGRVKRLSRGMLSALGVCIGLASRAPLTLFDEPYLGLDAAARQLFYDRLLRDYAEHPRTILLSTHLIDEIGDLIEHVLVLDRGRLIINEDADTLRGQVVTLTGPAPAVDGLAAAYQELHREQLGRTARVTVRGVVDAAGRSRAAGQGVEVEALSLQRLVVRLTGAGVAGTSDGPPSPSQQPITTVKEMSR